jgi:hypothetical protein
MRILTSFAVLAAMAIPAFAQDPNAHRSYEIGWNFASYSRQGSLNFYGGDLSLTGYLSQRMGIAADFAIHKNSTSGVDVTTTTYRFGPKFVMPRGKRFTAFGEILAGGTRLSGTSSRFVFGTTVNASQPLNGFALAVGGGVDIGIRPWFALRAPQVDYSFLHIGSFSSNGMRIGGGLVFRFGHD